MGTEWVASSEPGWHKFAMGRLRELDSALKERYRIEPIPVAPKARFEPIPEGRSPQDLSGLDESGRRAEVLGRRPSFLSIAFLVLKIQNPEPEF